VFKYFRDLLQVLIKIEKNLENISKCVKQGSNGQHALNTRKWEGDSY